MYGSHPKSATKSSKKKTPLEPARAGAEDGSSTDNTVTNTATEQTTRLMISTPEALTATAGRAPQNCVCGWTKVTSTLGLKIHQGKKGCLRKGQQGSRIDSYFLRSRPSQSTEVQQQDTHHSLQDINTPVPEEEDQGTGEQPESSTSRPSAEKKISGRRPLVNWPKSCDKTLWEEVNTDLCNILGGMKAFRASFTIRAAYDVLPSPANLSQWYGEDPTCPSPATLRHILVGCKTCLTQGRYTWRHNQVLRCLAAVLEGQRTGVNALPPPSSRWKPTPFVREGQTSLATIRADTGQLGRARDWKLLADLDKKLCFPPEIASTNLRPDLVLWSPSLKIVHIIELTVP